MQLKKEQLLRQQGFFRKKLNSPTTKNQETLQAQKLVTIRPFRGYRPKYNIISDIVESIQTLFSLPLKEKLRDFIDKKMLMPEQKPCLYLYSQQKNNKQKL